MASASGTDFDGARFRLGSGRLLASQISWRQCASEVRRAASREDLLRELAARAGADLGTVVQGVWSKVQQAVRRGSSDFDRSTCGKSASCGPPDNARQPTACYYASATSALQRAVRSASGLAPRQLGAEVVSLQKKPAGHNLGDEAGEAARSFTLFGGNPIPILVSALALIFSGVSLHETVLKQAHLHVFVPDTIAYTRDPDGSFEVFAIPLTVSNSGARDGIVTSLKLEVRNSATSATQKLEASYFAGSEYFSTKEDVANNVRRSKTPFAPLSVTGRGSITSTVLFYGRQYQEQRVVAGQGR